MAQEADIRTTWWKIERFREVGARKLPLWHALVYLTTALASWAAVAFVFFIPKLLTEEFGESLSIGFVFTFYGFIFHTFSCLKDSYQVIKANNLARYAIVWLGCWSVMGVRLTLLLLLPLFFVVAMTRKALPYNQEDILFFGSCILLIGIHISYVTIENVFGVLQNNEKVDREAEGVADHA